MKTETINDLEELAKLKKQAAPLLERIKQLEKEIKTEVLKTGEPISHAGIDQHPQRVRAGVMEWKRVRRLRRCQS